MILAMQSFTRPGLGIGSDFDFTMILPNISYTWSTHPFISPPRGGAKKQIGNPDPIAARPDAMLGATAAEQAAGSLAPSTLEAVTEQLLQTGFCILGNVVPHAVLDQLNPQLDLQAAQHVALSLQDGGAAGLQAPARGWSLPGGFPRTQPHCHPLIVTNPLIEQVVAATLEEGAFLSFCNGNCNATRPVPGAPLETFDAGGLHHDGPWVFRTRAAADEAGLSGWPHQPTALVVNFGTDNLGRAQYRRGRFRWAIPDLENVLQLWADELGLGGAFSSHIPTCDALT
jgi:hypothetical protein